MKLNKGKFLKSELGKLAIETLTKWDKSLSIGRMYTSIGESVCRSLRRKMESNPNGD